MWQGFTKPHTSSWIVNILKYVEKSIRQNKYVYLKIWTVKCTWIFRIKPVFKRIVDSLTSTYSLSLTLHPQVSETCVHLPLSLVLWWTHLNKTTLKQFTGPV